MENLDFSSYDLLILLKAYDIAVRIEPRRPNWETRRGYIKISNSCMQYLIIIDEVANENIFSVIATPTILDIDSNMVKLSSVTMHLTFGLAISSVINIIKYLIS